MKKKKNYVIFNVIIVSIIIVIVFIAKIIYDKNNSTEGSDQYYYNQIKTEHPNWHHNAIEDNLFFLPYCDSVAYFIGPHNDETYYYKGDTLYFMDNLTGIQTKVALKDTL